jgi:dynein light chain LC8-type
MAEKQDSSLSTDTGTAPRDSGSTAGPKAIIKNVDMSEEMQQETVDIASGALEKFNIEKDIAAQIKKELDRRHGPTWHVVVGKNFGSYVTHGEPLSSAGLIRFDDASLAVIYANHPSLSYPHFIRVLTSWISETKHFIYFYVGSLAILIWKS